MSDREEKLRERFVSREEFNDIIADEAAQSCVDWNDPERRKEALRYIIKQIWNEAINERLAPIGAQTHNPVTASCGPGPFDVPAPPSLSAEQIRKLVAKWRERAQGFDRDMTSNVCLMAATQNRMCADELEAALRQEGQIGGTVGLDGDTQRDWASDGPALEKRVKELEGAVKPAEPYIPSESLMKIINDFIDVPATEPNKFNEFFHKLEQREAELRDRVLEEAAQVARRTPFRAHAQNDVDFHSGCEQTRERIVDAIRALKSQVSAAGAASHE